jgi:hypothetical protein
VEIGEGAVLFSDSIEISIASPKAGKRPQLAVPRAIGIQRRLHPAERAPQTRGKPANLTK